MSNLRQVAPLLWVGDDNDCSIISQNREWARVHAAKTCHMSAIGYRGSLNKSHPEYLVAKRDHDLYLNMIDPPSPNFFSVDLFDPAFHFIKTHIGGGENVLVHCNHGYSRSPSVALVYLAKAGQLESATYESALKAYRELDPTCEPGSGIWSFLTDNWKKVMGRD